MLLAVSLSVVLAMCALAIDVTYARMVQQQLQNGTDASALGAVLVLDGTEEGVEQALSVASELAGTNTAGGQSLSAGGIDGSVAGTTSFGVWDSEDQSFMESGDPEEINAVRIQMHHDHGYTGVLTTVSETRFKPAATSTAVRNLPGASEVDCFIPVAVPSCLITDVYGTEGMQDVDLVLNPAGVDNAGWGRPGATPNASWVRSQITDCGGDGKAAIGDSMGLGNGVMQSALSQISRELESSATSWDSEIWGSIPEQDAKSTIDADSYGGTVEGPILVFEDDSYCTGAGGSWNETMTISGFVWGAIYDVTGGSAADKNIKLRLDTTSERVFGTDYGDAPDWGVQAVQVVLTQ